MRVPTFGSLRLRSLAFALSVSAFLPFAAQSQITPYASCIEFPVGNSNAYVARFSYRNLYSTPAYIPGNTQLNLIIPVRTAALPTTFAVGFNYQALAVLVPKGYGEVWHLDDQIAYTSQTLDTDGFPLMPVCPVLLRPATLNYTAAGTYNNVYLAQVNSGPGGGVTMTAQPSAGITVSNLVYTPADAASPITKVSPYEPNPNSVYGTVTVAAGAAANSTIGLVVNVNGTTQAQTIVPLTFTPPAYTISGMAANGQQAGAGLTVASGQSLLINALFSYSGKVQPTGAISLQVDGTGYGLSNQSCTYKTSGSPHQNCAVNYYASGPAGTHTFTFSQAGDANYSPFTGSATITVTPPVVSSAAPAVPAAEAR